MVNPANFAKLDQTAKTGIAAISTAFGLIPICQQKGKLQNFRRKLNFKTTFSFPDLPRKYTDKEANLMCQSRGFDCGMLNRTVTNKIPASNDELWPGVFATVQCQKERVVTCLKNREISFRLIDQRSFHSFGKLKKQL